MSLIVPGKLLAGGLILASFVLGNSPVGIGLGLSAAVCSWWWGRGQRHGTSRSVFVSWRFWVLPFVLMVVAPFLSPHPDHRLWGLGFSEEVFKQGLGFLFRAWLFVLVIGYILSDLSLSILVKFFQRARFPRLGLRLTLALGVMHTVERGLEETWRIYRSRHPRILGCLFHIHIYLGAVLRQSARQAEETAHLFFLRNIDLDGNGP